MPRTRPPRPTLVVLLLALVAAAATASVPAPAAAGPTAWYPDPPTGVGTELAPLPEAGQDEDANWAPFLGNRELWCTNGNPGYAGCASHHGYPALDIGMPIGTRIYAAGPGRVASAGSDGDARGTYVDIQHDDGIHSRYYHLSAESVSVGQRVERGTPIGRSGMSGRTTSPHLHYEERTAGNGQKDPGVMFGTSARPPDRLPERDRPHVVVGHPLRHPAAQRLLRGEQHLALLGRPGGGHRRPERRRCR